MDTFGLDIHTVNNHGIGIAKRHSGKFLVPGALTGETVDARLFQRPYRAPVAKIINLRNRAAQRRDPGCRWFPECPGCQIRHMQPAVQKAFALNRLSESWRRRAGSELRCKNISFDSLDLESGYRNRCSLKLLKNRGLTVLGMPSWFPGDDPIPLDHCPNQLPSLNDFIARIRDVVNACPGKNDLSAIQEVRCFLSAEGPHHVVVVVLEPRGTTIKLPDHFVQAMQSIPSILWRLDITSQGMSTRFKKARAIGSPRPLKIRVSHRIFTADANAWLPVTATGEEMLIRVIRKWLPSGSNHRFVEVGCGVGTLSILLAETAGTVTGIDVDRLAIEAAEKNCPREHRRTVRFRTGEGTHAMRRLLRDRFAADVAIVHGMRRPYGASLFEALNAAGITRLVLASPAVHAWCSDAVHLEHTGWSLDAIALLDQLPHTSGFMTIGCLRKDTVSL